MVLMYTPLVAKVQSLLAAWQFLMKKGLLAHSDGDVALHALTDALLGAVALGDIGKLFPDTDMQYKGADSRGLLREAYAQVQAKGYKVGNVDVTIIAQAPKMRPHIDAMRAAMPKI